MSLKIALGTIFYNSHYELQRLAKSIPRNCIDYWFAVDGPFRYIVDRNPDISLRSVDGSRLFLSLETDYLFKRRVYLMDGGGLLEPDKRQIYLDKCKDKNVDILIIIDSDEFFSYPPYTDPVEQWKVFRDNIEDALRKTEYKHNVFSMLESESNGDIHARPRVWFKPGDMEYLYGSHYHYGNMKTEYNKIMHLAKFRSCYNQHSAGTIEGITLSHSDELRHKENIKLRSDYDYFLLLFESLVQSQKMTVEQAYKLASEKARLQNLSTDLKTLVKK